VNLAIAVVVFPVIFLGELLNKTMIASVALATRGWCDWSQAIGPAERYQDV